MKKQLPIGMGLVEIAIVSLLSLGLAGCSQEKQDAAVPAAPAVEQVKAIEPLATNVAPAAVDPAAAKPKDHPAH